jgi:hypothetical protein
MAQSFVAFFAKSLKKAHCMPATTAEELYQRLLQVAAEKKSSSTMP